MSRPTRHWARRFAAVTFVLLAVFAARAEGTFPGVGRTATPDEIKAWDIDVRPDFKGLPPGSGSVAKGQEIWETKCAACHGTFGESNEVFTPLVGGTTADDIRTGRVKSLTSPETARTTLMKVPTVSTLWDYINRAMPWNAPKSLTHDEVYAVLAYLLNLGDILPSDFVLSDRNIAEVQARMPNRNGMTRQHGLWDVKAKGDVANIACMKDCPTQAGVASQLPEYAKDAHGDLSAQQRLIGPKPATTGEAPPDAKPDPLEFARRKGCLACHGVDRKIMGPAFKDVAGKYKGDGAAASRLAEKVRKGGSGVWGPRAMPPHPDLSAADTKALVEWVLGL